MNFENIINKFIDYLEKELKELSSVTYKRKIYVFYEYVTIKLQAKDVNFQSILTAMRTEQFLEALEYYVKTYNIKFATTAWNYFFAISSFYQFLYDEFNWENKLFSNKSENAELKKCFEEKIVELKLNTSERVFPLSNEQAREFISLCDEMLSMSDDEILDGHTNGDFSNYISSLICKIIILYGTKNNVINNIKLDDYNPALNKLKINDLWIHLPDKLALQMLRYIKIREKLIEGTKSDKLFVDIVKNRRNLAYSKMFKVLNKFMGYDKGGAIAKYGIVQMIQSGVPSGLIKKFTGYKDVVFNHCVEIVDEQSGIVLMNEKSKLLDTTFRKQELFDIM